MEAVIVGAVACRAAAGAATSGITAAAEADGSVVATVGTGSGVVDADRTPGAEAGEADTAGPEDVWAATGEATLGCANTGMPAASAAAECPCELPRLADGAVCPARLRGVVPA